MTGLGYVLVGLALGVAVGAAVAAVRGRSGAQGTSRLEARLEVQSAELRRLADAGSVRDGESERVRSELAGAREALRELALRDDERRERDRESWEVVRRLRPCSRAGRPRAGPARTSCAITSPSCRPRCS